MANEQGKVPVFPPLCKETMCHQHTAPGAKSRLNLPMMPHHQGGWGLEVPPSFRTPWVRCTKRARYLPMISLLQDMVLLS
jgi:hypothetical protein